MGKEGSGSIFDEAGKQSQNRALRKQQRERPPLPAAPASIPKSEGVPTDAEMKTMFSRMRQIHEDLKGKMLDVYQKSGIPLKEIDDFLDDPKGVSDGQMAAITADMKKLETDVASVLGDKARKMAMKIREKKAEQKRKKKFIGNRRNWLEM